MPRPDERDALAIATVRFLAVDMVEAAASGHPGAPLGLAPLAHVLWSRHLRADPADPAWPDRDRFVLSCGHASALLYALLHLAGYDLPLAELRRFRQLDSKTPGHPEHGHTPGVETTTGPLGQGLGNAVGMALAQRALAARFNRDGFPLFDHRIWAFVSDGDLMEGVASEASSLAGHQRLGRLKVFYDSNGISIDGPTTLAFTEDVAARYAAYGWRVLRVEDGNDLDELEGAVAAAGAEDELPTLVVVRTHIGYGSPKQDTAAVHGAPLGAEAARATREKLGWPHAETFVVPDAARELYAETATRNAVRRRAWRELLGRYRAAHPEPAAELERRLAGRLPEGWDAELPVYGADAKPIATRAASGQALNALARRLPELVGGSADLAESNLTTLHGEASAQAGSPAGRNFNFGVREHAMASALNGLALSGLLRPYGGTFLIFSDYLKPALRLAALMRLPVVHVFTHDSLFLGEDGPTHQPIGQLAGLRAIPGLVVLRPGDARETNEAWRVAIERRDGPTALALTRQKLPVLAETAGAARSGVARGAYVLWRSGPDDDGVALLATGSELHVALGAGKRLAEGGVAARVVSMPSWELFERQEPAYRESVLPRRLVRRLAVEAASPFGWHRWVGSEGAVQGIETFGASAPAEALAPRFGLTVEAVLERALALAGRPV